MKLNHHSLLRIATIGLFLLTNQSVSPAKILSDGLPQDAGQIEARLTDRPARAAAAKLFSEYYAERLKLFPLQEAGRFHTSYPARD
jgi:hypothetical protein